MCVINIAQRNLRALDLVSCDEWIFVVIAGDAEFCQLQCRSSIFRDSFSARCDKLSDISVPVCMNRLILSNAADSTSRYHALDIPGVVSRQKHVTKYRWDFVFFAALEELRIRNRGRDPIKANRGNRNQVWESGAYALMAVQGSPVSVDVCNSGAEDFGSADNCWGAVIFWKKTDVGVNTDTTND